MRVEHTLLLDQGESVVEFTLLVPQYEHWQSCGWRVWVDDRLAEQLSGDDVNLRRRGPVGASVLIAGQAGRPAGLDPLLATVGSGAHFAQVAPPASWPTLWSAYSMFDVVVIPADRVEELANAWPAQWAALARWIGAGGNLWLVDANPDWRELPSVERALGASGSHAPQDGPKSSTDDADEAILARGWKFAALGERGQQPLEMSLALSRFEVVDQEPQPARTRGAPSVPSPVVAPTSRRWFAVRGYGLGLVAAFRVDLRLAPTVPGNDPALSAPDGDAGFGELSLGGVLSPPPPESDGPAAAISPAEAATAAIMQSLLYPRLAWTSRHGLKPDESHADFNTWLIPGVGVAPVGVFQFLITLFVLAIGPLNYWWFKRRNKLPMVLATAPVAAAAVTLALLTYGTLADGLGVRARARSLTLLDQTSSELVHWSRRTYYAGLAPRDGLTLPREAVAYPITASTGRRGSWARTHARRTLQWTADQRLASGWLPARTPTQHLVIVARPTEKRLDIRPEADGLRIRNGLGVAASYLIVQGHQGGLYGCEHVAAGETALAAAIKPSDAASRLRRLMLDNFPELPPGIDRRRSRWMSYGPTLAGNIMEAQLEAITSPVVRGWGDGSYIAITDRAVDQPDAAPNIREEAGFHVIQGRWR